MLAEAWVVPHPLQIFRGFGGGKLPPLPPPLATPLIQLNHLYMVNSNYLYLLVNCRYEASPVTCKSSPACVLTYSSSINEIVDLQSEVLYKLFKCSKEDLQSGRSVIATKQSRHCVVSEFPQNINTFYEVLPFDLFNFLFTLINFCCWKLKICNKIYVLNGYDYGLGRNIALLQTSLHSFNSPRPTH